MLDLQHINNNMGVADAGLIYFFRTYVLRVGVRQRGYDQAKLLARQVARQTGLAYLGCLVRQGQAHQVGSSRHQRLSRLEHTFRVKKTAKAPAILVDDVTTTGATIESAAAALRLAGFQRVEGLTFAQAQGVLICFIGIK